MSGKKHTYPINKLDTKLGFLWMNNLPIVGCILNYNTIMKGFRKQLDLKRNENNPKRNQIFER